MPKKPIEKPIRAERLGRKISPVFVANNERLRPYAEIFLFEAENIEQKPLGSLLGFFKINDTSIESAYIVNFLTSVLKKEYFSRTQRAPMNALEASLNKVNLALSELAKQGNIAWLGNLEATVCILENNSLHFSVSGTGKIFLFRNGMLTDISEGLASEEESPHPLKTFTDISSGRLRKEDRIILSTRELLDLLDTSSIQRESARFNHEEFSRFVHTALVNEFDLAATTIIDFFEETIKTAPALRAAKKTSARKSLENVFSQNTFRNEITEADLNQLEDNDTSKEPEINSSEYTDKTTGHIYIQQQNMTDLSNTSYFSKHYPIWKETALEKWEHVQSFLQLSTRRAKRQAEEVWKDFSAYTSASIANWKQKRIEQQKRAEQERERRSIEEEREGNNQKSIQMAVTQKIQKNKIRGRSTQKKSGILREQSERVRRTPISDPQEELDESKVHSLFSILKQSVPKFTALAIRFLIVVAQRLGTIFIPRLQKARSIFSKMNSRQKTRTLLILAFIFIAPLVFSQLKSEETANKKSSIEEIIPPKQQEANPMESEINAILYKKEDLKKITSFTEPVQKIFALENSALAAVGDKHIFIITNGQQNIYSIANMPNVSFVESAYMPDLHMIFLYTSEKKLYSFSTNNRRFEENNIALNQETELPLFASYLTYLYVLYPESKTIYRYPRAEGGFSEGKKWLKETVNSLADATSWSVDGTIYTTTGNEILRLFQGKHDASLDLEATRVPAKFDAVYTQDETAPIAILDKEHARIIVYSKDNALLKQFVFPSDFKIRTFIATDKQATLLLESGELIGLSTE